MVAIKLGCALAPACGKCVGLLTLYGIFWTRSKLQTNGYRTDYLVNLYFLPICQLGLTLNIGRFCRHGLPQVQPQEYASGTLLYTIFQNDT